MEDKRKERVKRLEQEIVAELEKSSLLLSTRPGILFSVPITRLMNRLRKWQTRFFKPGAIRSGQKGDKELLSPGERIIYDSFDACRSEYRQLNSHYSDQYRGGYMLNYNFAVIAVSLAVLSIYVLYFDARVFHNEHLILIILFFVGLGKFILLLIILVNTRQANGAGFNHRAITVRYVMEQFRCMCYLSLLNIRRLPQMSDAKYLSRKWKNNYLDRFVRSKIRSIFEQFDLKALNSTDETDMNERLPVLLEFIQADWIEQQINYQKQKQETQEALFEKLEKFVNGFNITVLIAVGVDVAIGIAGLFGVWPERVHFFEKFGGPLIMVSVAIIPALVASYNGLKSQTESSKLAERAGSMIELLDGLNLKYQELRDRIARQKGQPDNPGSFTSETISLLNDTASIMIQEVTEWTFIYSGEVRE
jgi:hypothetical protein